MGNGVSGRLAQTEGQRERNGRSYEKRDYF